MAAKPIKSLEMHYTMIRFFNNFVYITFTGNLIILTYLCFAVSVFDRSSFQRPIMDAFSFFTRPFSSSRVLGS